jgi:CDP-diacylglycerol--glycerol-3-phosphate 3-phosphatidyltransferase
MKWFCRLNTPNKLTLLRVVGLLFILIVYFLPLNQVVFFVDSIGFSLKRLLIIVLFVVSAYTDHLDGKIARKRQIVTTFGKFLDPIADKILVNVLFFLLAFSGEITVLVPLLFLIRDTIVDAVRLIMIEKKVVIAASNLGKAKTASQMAALCLLLIYNLPFALWNVPIALIVTYLAAFISLLSGFDYVYKNRKTLFEGADYRG